MTTVNTQVFNGADGTFTLSQGSNAGRMVVILAVQQRSTLNLTGFTFNGVAGQQLGLQNTAGNSRRSLVVLFNDSALPATAGTYNVARNTTSDVGSHYAVIELSGMDNTATPEVLQAAPASGTDPFSLTFANNVGAFLGGAFCADLSTGSSITGGAGQTNYHADQQDFLTGKTASAADTLQIASFNETAAFAYVGVALSAAGASGPDYTQRKGSSFDATHTLGTITTATLNGTAITINSTGAGTVNLTDTSGITTSGEYNLVLGDGAATQTQTVQVNVFGVVPSNNPAQKDGSALASLTGIQIRITAGANLNGTQVYYSGTETTDASGNFSVLDVSTSAAVAADPVRMQVLTAAGDSITSAETVGLI
jgi:hypothetical protein